MSAMPGLRLSDEEVARIGLGTNRSLGHLRENLAALEIELSDAELQALRSHRPPRGAGYLGSVPYSARIRSV
jgi:hypothetical protein